MSDVRTGIADTLRGRLLRALHAGLVKRGDRLPSARDLRHEFNVDHRLVLDAYRELEREGLIELRARGGVYVASDVVLGDPPMPSARWMSEFLAQSVAREIPLPELHDWLRRAVETRRLRAVAVQSTEDTLAGLCRELSDDYGLEASGLHVDALANGGEPPAELRYADLVLTTPALEPQVRPIVDKLRRKLIVVEIRSDLIGGEWRLMLRRPVYVIVRDERFVQLLREFFADTPGAENIRPIVLGRDAVEDIPSGATVYITHSARSAMGAVTIRGRILPAARLFSPATSRQIVDFIVDANLRALANDPR